MLDLNDDAAKIARAVSYRLGVLRYPGGKAKLVKHVHQLLRGALPDPDLIVEPFAGGASMTIAFLEGGYGHRFILGDLDPLVASLWSVVFSPRAERLARRIETVAVTIEEWDRCRGEVVDDPEEMAFRCLFLNRTSFSGILHRNAGPIGGRSQAGRWTVGARFNQPAVANRVRALSRHAHRVQVVNADWQSTLAMARDSADADRTAWFFDPPYFKRADKLYRQVFATEDHLSFRAAVDAIPGPWVVTYDDVKESRAVWQSHPGLLAHKAQYSAYNALAWRPASELVVTNVLPERELSAPAHFEGPVEARELHPA